MCEGEGVCLGLAPDLFSKELPLVTETKQPRRVWKTLHWSKLAILGFNCHSVPDGNLGQVSDTPDTLISMCEK